MFDLCKLRGHNIIEITNEKAYVTEYRCIRAGCHYRMVLPNPMSA